MPKNLWSREILIMSKFYIAYTRHERLCFGQLATTIVPILKSFCVYSEQFGVVTDKHSECALSIGLAQGGSEGFWKENHGCNPFVQDVDI
jgi:hypothetical protein